ncbi:MAG: methionine--tRNA ligase [Planctomycetota bacterium]|nr:methionine--tRNA ligase [Planctomycetota bacterium]
MTRRILVTSALPYANGHIHLGHLVEYLQTDIWVRFQKLRENRCIYLCADDTHGTAIMIRAQQEGRKEEALIAAMREDHLNDFSRFGIQFDNYGSTHSDANRKLCADFWKSLRKQDLIVEREVSQLFDPKAGTFLADRFVKGTCPNCKSADQYGDSCSVCSATYSPTELIDPYSTLSGARPEIRRAPHLFIQLEKLRPFLTEWSQSGEHLQPEIANYLKGNFLGDPLRDWDVSRPAPYFGFEIPDSPGNYWYVWFDAPIGYMASTLEWCERQTAAGKPEKFDDWWRSEQTRPNDPAEIHHFIGKDITYFHTLFWPGMLRSAGYSLPKKVHVHGFLTVDGQKMSKSTGTFIRAAKYLDHLDPAYLRYYYAGKLTPRVDDLDLNLDEFVAKVNSDLVGKVVNLASRTARFVQDTGLSAKYPADDGLFESAARSGEEIAAAYEACDYNRAMRQIMLLADRANQYVDSREPWKLKKDLAKSGELQDICSVTLNLFRQIVIYLAPVLPRLAEQTGELLNDPIRTWSQSLKPLSGTPVAVFKPLLTRITKEQVEKMIEESKETSAPSPSANVANESAASTPAGSSWNDGPESLAGEPLAAECTIDDFVKVDLRVARIVAAEDVAEAKKLLKLTLSLGGEETRQVFAGIKSVYKPADLVGRLVICVANLAPRQMKFGLSQGMVAAAGAGGTDIFLLSPDSGAKPGMRVH